MADAAPTGLWRNVGLLALCQALLLTNGVTLVAVNGLAGLALAPDRRLATLPVTAYVIGAAMTTLPASHFMKRHGRRAGFMLGSVLGIVGALTGALALELRSFWLLCGGTLMCGMYNAFGQYYRFAAADSASVALRPRAISLVMAGGILGGVIGPEMSKVTRDLAEPAFLASYATLGLVALLAMALASFLRIPAPPAADVSGSGRPLSEIMRQPTVIVAVTGALVGYGVMNLLMSATPLAMDICRHPYNDAALVLEWHVIGMFAPSFFTGSLITRFGVLRIMFTGALLMVLCIAIALSGTDLMQFLGALLLLGVGWNFLFVGGTTLLTETHTVAERAKTQGVNDFLVFLTMAVTSLSSGIVVTGSGWATLNLLAIPFVVLAAGAITWLGAIRRNSAPAT